MKLTVTGGADVPGASPYPEGEYVQVKSWPLVEQFHPVPAALPRVNPTGSVPERVISFGSKFADALSPTVYWIEPLPPAV